MKIVAASFLVVAGAVAASCASFGFGAYKSERAADGTIHLTCAVSLPRCLEHAEALCAGARYEVVRATDDHDYYGPAGPGETETRASTAVVKCGSRGRALFGDKAAPPPAAAPPAPASAGDAGAGVRDAGAEAPPQAQAPEAGAG